MKLGLVFSGQGAQYAGMGKSLYDNNDQAKAIFEAAGEDIKSFCFHGTEEELARTDITQPCMYTATIAALEAFKSLCDMPVFAVAGFSLGEYAALTAANVFGFEAGLSLITKRGKWMEEAAGGKGRMAAVLGDREKLLEAVKIAESVGLILPVNYNCPGQTVVAGENAAMDIFVEEAAKYGLKVIPLKVSGAFHSPMMESVSEKIAGALEEININEPSMPIYSNVTAKNMQGEDIKALISLQVKSPVLWEKTILHMKEAGIDTIVEIGVGKTLCGLIRKIDKEIKTYNIDSFDSLQATVASLIGG